MKFNFRLERLLQLRQAAEQQQASALGDATTAEAVRRAAVQESSGQLDAVQSQLTGSGSEPAAAGLWHAYGLTVEAAAMRQESDEAALREAEEQRRTEEERFTEARMARRVIERLREKREADWTTETNRVEQADLDEVAQRQAKNGGFKP